MRHIHRHTHRLHTTSSQMPPTPHRCAPSSAESSIYMLVYDWLVLCPPARCFPDCHAAVAPAAAITAPVVCHVTRLVLALLAAAWGQALVPRSASRWRWRRASRATSLATMQSTACATPVRTSTGETAPVFGGEGMGTSLCRGALGGVGLVWVASRAASGETNSDVVGGGGHPCAEAHWVVGFD